MKKEIKKYQLLDSKGYGDFSKTFLEIRDFLQNLEFNELKKLDYPWGRWAWMFSLPYLDKTFIQKISYYKDNHEIVALLTYESSFGDVYYVIKDGYEFLKAEMIQHAIDTFDDTNQFRILIPDYDLEMKEIAKSFNLFETDHTEYTYMLDLNRDLSYELKEGFKVTSLAEEYNLKKYGQCLFQGFNHEGPYEPDEEELNDRSISLSALGVNLNRNIAIVEPNGDFVSYCGTWYHEGSVGVLLEPVATVPLFRKMGLGKAAIYEALQRAKDKGAKIAVVGSNQEFYQKLGFTYYFSSHFWKKIK
ncbi:MAG: GNAT family N-acetyltransferase [Firmicutes bacterium]|nr:GNAT family N-acetyltransferase [Bacillota bacterium]